MQITLTVKLLIFFMKTSLKNIAEKLNLSKTTVSWVLSGKGEEKGISLKTQERIVKCAKEMHYRPNLLARSLNTGLSGTIGLIIPDITDSFYSKVARSIEMEAEAQGYSLMICSSESDINRENRMIHLFKAKQVDGIILVPTKVSKVEVENLISESYPLVLFDRYFPELKTNYVIIDNEGSSYQLVRKIIANGAKKIAIITTNSYLYTMSMRKKGYIKALEEAGLDTNPNLHGEVQFTNYETEIFEVLDAIFKKVPDVDGFFFTTHILALEAFRYFYERGIDINKGFGLACIHGVSAFRALAPQMLIARMPTEEIGHHAVNILLNEIKYNQTNENQEREPDTIILDCPM